MRNLSEQQALILERLVEAMETDIALPVRVGPRMFGSSMPDYLQTDKEVWLLEREEWTDNRRDLTKRRHAERHRQAERRAKCTAKRISRMEEAFEWIIRYVWDAEVRECLMAYATVKARSWDWGRFVTQRNRRNPQKKPWLRQNCYRWISKSLQIIEQQISNSGFLLDNEGGLQMRQIRPELTCKSITSGLRAWSPTEGIPA
jgi:hypothetical protein